MNKMDQKKKEDHVKNGYGFSEGRLFRAVFRNPLWRRAIMGLCVCMVFGTTYALILPAVTMTGPYPTLQADTSTAWSGDELEVRVNAENPGGQAEKIVVLSAEGLGAGLSEEYIFDEFETTEIVDDAGNMIELHRTVRKNAKATIDYWFSLPQGTETSFVLSMADRIDTEALMREIPRSDEEMRPGEEGERAIEIHGEKRLPDSWSFSDR